MRFTASFRKRPGRPAGAFTLIEIMVSLVLITLIIGIGVLSIDSLNDEKKLRLPAGKMRDMAREAMRRAITQQRSFSIFINQNIFMLRETYVRQEDVDAYHKLQNESFADKSLFEDADVVKPSQRIIERYELGEGMTIQMRRWIETEFSEPKGQEWVFSPSGICEPVTIRFSNEKGYIEMDFNPLTAKVQDERMIIAN
jgi:hypothetical protein